MCGPTARPAAAKGGAKAQAIRRSRVGRTTKIHALTDVLGRRGVLLLTPGNNSDVTTAPAVLGEAPGRIRRQAADKSYDTDWLRTDLRAQGITRVIPGQARAQATHPPRPAALSRALAHRSDL